MLIAIIAVGSVVLAGLAVVVGYLEGHSQRAEWRDIAADRRELAEHGRFLDERSEALADCDGCPTCERRHRGEYPRD